MAMTHDEMIAILVAHRDGRRIHRRLQHALEWDDYKEDIPPTFDGLWEYRIDGPREEFELRQA